MIIELEELEYENVEHYARYTTEPSFFGIPIPESFRKVYC